MTNRPRFARELTKTLRRAHAQYARFGGKAAAQQQRPQADTLRAEGRRTFMVPLYAMRPFRPKADH